MERVAIAGSSFTGLSTRSPTPGEASQQQAEYLQRQVSACHRWYLAAVKMLATVQRLATTVIVWDVNIRRRQVNVNVVGKAEGPGDSDTPSASYAAEFMR